MIKFRFQSSSFRTYGHIRSLKYGVKACLLGQSTCTAAEAPCYSTAARDYLHESIVPTDHFQRSLPHLPVPKLEDTCGRYLASQLPLLTPDQYAHTETIVKQFMDGPGLALHKELVNQDKKNKHTSYISAPWFDMYLKDRKSVVLNHTPFMTFTDDTNPKYMDQLIRATNIVMSSLRFMKTYRANILEPDVFHLNPSKSDNNQFRRLCRMTPKRFAFYMAYWHKAFPLDMTQYPNLFNSTRIPRQDKDELYVDTSARHMLVMRNGHMYIFDALDTDGYILPPEEIMAHIQHILQDHRPPNDNSIGIFTTMDRNKWAKTRTQLCNADRLNPAILELVDSALFGLILDDHSPGGPNEISRNYLHGNGSNRWFDKSFSVVLTKNGMAAVNFEHSWGDGVAVLRYFNEVWKETTTKPFVHPDTVPAQVDSTNKVKHLDFVLDAPLQEAVRSAKEEFDGNCARLDLDHLEYYTFTKTFLKQQKVSPDAILQLVIQLAYYRQYGRTAATYESCSTAAFKKGRTETIRPCTAATKKACEMLLTDKSPHSVADLRQAISDCSSYHSKLTREAAMGQGWDRHLFALKTLAQQADGADLPELFADPAYAKISHILLSTSTLTSPAVVIGGFGAVTPDGYGIGYAVEEERIGFNVTNYPASGTNVHEFKDCLKQGLDDVYAVFNGQNPRS